jgi:hypothetical protein
MRRLVLVLVTAAVLVAVPQAAAAGPWLWTINGGAGIADRVGDLRYVARLEGGNTTLVARAPDGRELRSLAIPGRWGLQAATVSGALTGLSADGRTLVLTGPTRTGPLAESPFVVVRTDTFAPPLTIRVRGNMTVDALSPNGRLLYLIQHVEARGQLRYQVRAYDLRARKLLPRVIADKRQAGWLMSGMPLARVESVRGDRVYTLYQNGQNYPFVHALDTMHATAVCIGLPLSWTDPAVLDGVRMRLNDGFLVVTGPNTGGPIRVDLASYRVSDGDAP